MVNVVTGVRTCMCQSIELPGESSGQQQIVWKSVGVKE